MGVAECEGVGQPGAGFEAADASAANAPAANRPFSGIVGGRDVTLLEEKPIRMPVVTQAEQQFLQTGQGVHRLIVDTWRGLDLAIKLVHSVPAIRRQILEQLPHFI